MVVEAAKNKGKPTTANQHCFELLVDGMVTRQQIAIRTTMDNKEKSSPVNIKVVNTSSHDITIKRRTTLDHLYLVQCVTPLPVGRLRVRSKW